MSWLRVDLTGSRDPLPHDDGSPRSRRMALLRRLRSDPFLRGADALALAAELRVLELREAVDSLQSLR